MAETTDKSLARFERRATAYGMIAAGAFVFVCLIAGAVLTSGKFIARVSRSVAT